VCFFLGVKASQVIAFGLAADLVGQRDGARAIE